MQSVKVTVRNATGRLMSLARRWGATLVVAFDGVVAGPTDVDEPNASTVSTTTTIAQRSASEDESLSDWSMCDSLVVSEESLAATPARRDRSGGSAQPSPFDGEWVLCNPKGALADWLDSLTIDGDVVVDGNGEACRLTRARGETWLFGGRLARKGVALVRKGKSGGVQVYMRRGSR